MILKILSISIYLSLSYSFAKDVPRYKLSHKHKGCPLNSSCDKLSGEKYQRWSKELSRGRLKHFTRNYGMPIRIWSSYANLANRITFDSPCQLHRKKESKIYQSIIFVKSLSALKKVQASDQSVTNMTFSESGKSYIMPARSFPLGVKKGAIHFFKESDGNFYDLAISETSMKISKNLLPSKEILDTQCPEKLKKKFLSWKKKENLFQSYYCKKLWDFDKKKYESFIFGWSCQ